MTDAEIVYQHYLKSTIKSRNEAIELLKTRNFTKLNSNYIHWFERKEKVVELKTRYISNLIKELSMIQVEDNESEPIISSQYQFGNDDTEACLVATSYIYTIVPVERCESLARNCANSAIWKLINQPNGKDAESCRKILNQ